MNILSKFIGYRISSPLPNKINLMHIHTNLISKSILHHYWLIKIITLIIKIFF